jgi:hypothetical protein
MNRIARVLLLACAFLPIQFAHASSLQYQVIEEGMPGGFVKVKVIEEDPSGRFNQSAISQQVVYKNTFLSNEVPTLDWMLSKRIVPILKTIHSKMAPQPLWVPVKNAWTEADEDAYSAWFASQVNKKFDQGSGLDADCADMGLLFRWVYARNNLLPIANTLSGSGKLFGHFSASADWDQLPTDPDWRNDERFKAALRYLFDNTYTWSVVGDLYPTLINPEYVRPGSMFMIIRASGGHTQTVQNIDPVDGITTLWGNEPASEVIEKTGLLIEMKNQQTFGRWRLPKLNGSVWTLIPADQMPGFSLEQFQQNFQDQSDFEDFVDFRLSIHPTAESRLNGLIRDFNQAISARMTVIAQGLVPCYFNICATTSADYNNYSTFARDARIQNQVQEITAQIAKMGSDNETVQDVLDALQQQGEIIIGSGLTFVSLINDPTGVTKFNPDPRVSYAARWGISQTADPVASDFLGLSQAVDVLLMQRAMQVSYGYHECQNGCDTNSAQIKALNTATSDAQLKALLPKLESAALDPKLNPTTLQFVENYYDHYKIYNVSSSDCQSQDNCTLKDVVWTPGAVDRILKWTSTPTDTINVRWGLSI